MCDSDDDGHIVELPLYVINDILELIRCASVLLVSQNEENRDELIDQLERVLSQMVVPESPI